MNDIGSALISVGVVGFIIVDGIEEVFDSVGISLGGVLELVYGAVFEYDPNLTRRHIRVVLKVHGGHLTFDGTATAS